MTQFTGIDLAKPDSEAISIVGHKGPLVTIYLADGRLEYGPGYTPDEAAKAFWEALAQVAKVGGGSH